MANDLTLVLRLLADAQSALKGVQAVNAEVRETGTEAQKARASAEGLGVGIVNAGQDGSEAIAQLSGKLALAMRDIDELKAKLAATRMPKLPTPETEEFDRTAAKAAQSAGYMAAQLNDVAMMAIAGQSPLQLAIQQGTQITQGFGQAGAAGALAMLKNGFMQMLNPMNLVMIAALALGAALVQQLLSGVEPAKTLEDRLDDLRKAVDDYAAAAKNAAAPSEDLAKKYGSMAAAAREALRAIQETERVESLRKLGEAVDAISEKFGTLRNMGGGGRSGGGASTTEALLRSLQSELGLTREQAEGMRSALDQLNAAEGLQAQAEAARHLDDLLMQTVASVDDLTPAGLEFHRQLNDIVERAAALQGSVETVNGRVSTATATVVDFGAAFDAVVRAANQVVDAQPGSDFLSTAIARAQSLAGFMWSAAGAALSLSQKNPALRGPAGMGDASTAFTSPHAAALAADEAAKAAELARTPPTLPSPSSGAGGGGKSALQSTVDQGTEIMATLDQSLAAVNEKVSAGLISTAEGTQAIADAKDRAANALAELIPLLDKLGPAGKVQADTWRAALADLSDQLKGVQDDTTGLASIMTEGFKAPFAAFLAGTKSASAAWGDFLDYVDNAIAQKLSDQFTTQMLGPVLDAVFSGFSGMFKFADGGVPGISGLSGQVLTQPTLFAMPGGGLGEAGEAGTEAVMPLKQGPRGLSVTAVMGGREVLLGLTRGSDGKLGVEIPTWSSPAMTAPQRFAKGGVPGGTSVGASGASAAPGGGTVVNVVNNAKGAEPVVSERLEGNTRIIDVMINQVRDALAEDIALGRGSVPGALQTAFGLSRMGR